MDTGDESKNPTTVTWANFFDAPPHPPTHTKEKARKYFNKKSQEQGKFRVQFFSLGQTFIIMLL